MHRITLIALTAAAAALSACVGNKAEKTAGGFYGGDSAPAEKRDFDGIPDAVPRFEFLSKYGNKPYEALGRSYRPLKSAKGFEQTGVASWYGEKFHGRRTSSGETYDMWAMTAAHPTLPLPTYVEVTNLDTDKRIIVKVNDRGPFLYNRIIDLSFAAAHKLGIANKGTGRVKIKAIDPADYTVSDYRHIPESSLNPDRVLYPAGPVARTAGLKSAAGFGFYILQIGAFRSYENARRIRQRLSNQNFILYPPSENEFLNWGTPFRVQLGPFYTIESALQTKSEIRDIYGQDPLLIPN